MVFCVFCLNLALGSSNTYTVCVQSWWDRTKFTQIINSGGGVGEGGRECNAQL